MTLATAEHEADEEADRRELVDVAHVGFHREPAEANAATKSKSQP
jgi:hypothetical protein